jgi:secreted trypsin-like serine protease
MARKRGNSSKTLRGRCLPIMLSAAAFLTVLSIPGIASAHRARTFPVPRRSVAALSRNDLAGGRSRLKQPLPPRRRANVSAAIVGGSDARAGSFPWLAYVYDNLGNGTADACSGTVVSANLVLTAGHCAEDVSTGIIDSASGFTVITGRLDVSDSTGGQVSAVTQVLPYPEYDPADAYGDAALLVLATPTAAPSLTLATPADLGLLTAGTSGQIAGWGLLSGSNPDLPSALQWASTVLQGPSVCASEYGASVDVSSELCAVDYPTFSTGTCNGDSGGPLIAFRADGTPVEIGITSRGPLGCDTNEPDIFTRSDLVSPWEVQEATSLAQLPPSSPPSSPPTTPTPTATPTTPSPTTSTPGPSPSKPSVQRMSEGQAKRYVRQTLQRAFGKRFRRGTQFSSRCSRMAATRFACSTNWSYGPSDYFGTVTVLYKLSTDQQVRADHYVVRWVNNRCYSHSGHPRRCRVYTARGTY